MNLENVTENQPRKTIFSRILLEISLPLFFLSLVFCIFQLNREMNAIHEAYKINSRLSIETVQHALNIKMKRVGPTDSQKDYEILLGTLKKNDTDIRLSIYDSFEQKLYFDKNSDVWDKQDHSNLETALYQISELGKPYHVDIRKSTRELRAYIPLKAETGGPRWVARIILPLPRLTEALRSSYLSLALIICLIFLAGFIISLRLAASIVKPIQALNEATQEIVRGRLGRHVQLKINTGDEIESLADTFDKMSDTIKAMNERAADANPLTKLPGNQLIFQELKKRIYEKQKFVLFHVDIDRFKVFNDHFGLGKGDEAIQRTADLLREAVRDKGDRNDFVGHQGGDDFVLITTPEKAEIIAETIIKRFDVDVIKQLYTAEDFERGYTMQIDRRRLAETGEERMARFPFIALSLAGVSNAKKDFADYFDCMNQAVDVKKEVKKKIESSFQIQK